MPQKIFDIVPPQKNFSNKAIGIDKKQKKPGVDFKKMILPLFALAFFVLGILAYLNFSSAEIELWLESELPVYKEAVVVEPGAVLGLRERIIQGKIFEEESIVSQKFSASGRAQREDRAKGIIRVYNNYSAETQPLVAETRFISADGKMFRSINREVVPGAKYVEGKLEPGYADIEVRAAEPGEDYNIGPTTFSIPGFAGTPKYTEFYGKSSESMKGGFKGETAQVTKEDIEKAENLLITLFENYESARASAEKQGFTLIKESIYEEIKSKESSAEPGDAVESFDYKIEIASKFIGFKMVDLEVLANDLITSELKEGEKIKQGTLKILSYSLESIEGEKALITASYEAQVYPEVNLALLWENILGAKRSDIVSFLESQPEIKRVQINSWPLFRTNAPLQREKIQIKINI